MSQIIFTLLIFAAAIAYAMYKSVNRMSQLPRPAPCPEATPDLLAAVDQSLLSWLALNGFKYENVYSFHVARLAIWTQAGSSVPKRYFSLMKTTKGLTREFITKFSDEISLTTTTTRSAFMLPRVFGDFLQAFPAASMEQLWESHLRGETHLTSQLGNIFKACQVSFIDGVGNSIRRQLAYVKSLSFWPVRGIYWFLVKRFVNQSRPIWDQNIDRVYSKFVSSLPN